MSPITAPAIESETVATRDKPLVFASVITYNGKRFLERCFETLTELTDYDNCRLVLVDNGSTDGSGEYVREAFPNVDVLRVEPNIGYAHGANEAIAHACRCGAKYVVLMNDDIAILHSEWLRHAVEYVESDPNIGIVAFAQVTSDYAPQAPHDPTIKDVEYLSSPALFMPVEVFERIGVFDEVYYVVCDEDDIGARTQAAGYRTVKIGIPVYHFGGGTHQHFSRRAAYLQIRNGIRFAIKNRGMLHAVARTVRIVDVACSPLPISFDKKNVSHCRIRNSGSLLGNWALWAKAVLWNLARLPQTLRIRAAEHRLIRAARAARSNTNSHTPRRQSTPTPGKSTY